MELQKQIIEHCAPTLASIKTANLFSIRFRSKNSLYYQLNILNQQFTVKGVVLKILKITDSTALIYLYRPNLLATDLKNSKAKAILLRYGYDFLSVEASIDMLSKRLCEREEFPHEIGLFLSYPPEDVEGFICNKGQNCNLCGYWKIYGDTNSALKKFAQYDKCKSIYKKLWENGKDILQLTVRKQQIVA